MSKDFDFMEGNYRFVCETAEPRVGTSRIVITLFGKPVRAFDWPSYKVWNVAAHSHDIVDGLMNESDDGISEAGSTGLGGNVYTPDGAL